MPSPKCRSFCLGLNVLNTFRQLHMRIIPGMYSVIIIIIIIRLYVDCDEHRSMYISDVMLMSNSNCLKCGVTWGNKEN